MAKEKTIKGSGASAGAVLEAPAATDEALESKLKLLQDIEKQIEEKQEELRVIQEIIESELAEETESGQQQAEADAGLGELPTSERELISEYALPEKAFAILLLGQMQTGLSIDQAAAKVQEYVMLRVERQRLPSARNIQQFFAEIGSRANLLSSRVSLKF